MATAPWLDHYDADVPSTLAPYSTRTLTDYLADAARERPDRPALLFKGATLTYRQLDRLSDACAAAFLALGVKREDRVGLLLPNCPQFFIAQFGAWKIGAIVAPLNPIYTERELEGPLNEHGIETIVTMTRFYDRVKRIQSKTPLKNIIATNIKAYFPPLLRALFTLAAREARWRSRDAGPWRSRSRAPAGAARRHERRASAADRRRSSGSVDERRHDGHAQRRAWHACRLRHIRPAGNRLDQIGAQTGSGPHPAPAAALSRVRQRRVQALAFINRNPLAIVPNPRDINDLVATIKRVKPAFFNGVPALYIALLNHPDVQQGKVDFKSIKICFSGAAALLAETKTRFEAMTGGRLVEGYSLTEAMMALCINPVTGTNKVGSIGMPLPDVQVRIVDGDEGLRQMPVGEVGEIVITGPQLMLGYWNRPDETAAVLREHVGESGTRALAAYRRPRVHGR